MKSLNHRKLKQQARKRQPLVAKAQSRQNPVPIISIFFLAIALIWSVNAHSIELSDAQVALERDIWIASLEDSYHLELRTIKELRRDNHNPFPFYLLSHLNLRKFSESPASITILKQAMQLAEQAINLNPLSEYGFIALANIQDATGQTDLALQTIARVPLKNRSWRSKFLVARLTIDKATTAESIASFEKAIQESQAAQDIIAPYMIAIVNSAYSPQDLDDIYRNWSTSYPQTIFNYYYAHNLIKLGQYEKAHKELRTIYTQNPQHFESMMSDAIILGHKLNQPQASAVLLQKVALEALDKTEIKSLAHYHRGLLYYDKGAYKLAQQDFVTAIYHSPTRYDTLSRIADHYQKNKEYQELEKLTHKIIEKIPGSASLYALLGKTLSEGLGQHQQAITAFNDAIILAPSRSELYVNLGLIHYRLEELSEALLSFQKASDLDPADAVARYNTACILARLERTDEALTALKEAVNLDPNLGRLAVDDSDFSSIKQSQRFTDIVDQTPQQSFFAH